MKVQSERKSKYSPQMQSALCAWLKKGCSYKDACAMEGISYETYRIWQTEKPVFSLSAVAPSKVDGRRLMWL